MPCGMPLWKLRGRRAHVAQYHPPTLKRVASRILPRTVYASCRETVPRACHEDEEQDAETNRENVP